MAGIYIHIPFCRKACHYCNFHFSTSRHRLPEMISAIEAEIENEQLPYGVQPERRIDTIYFGGGTPSLLSTESIGRILDKIYAKYNVSAGAEITLEANPDDITEEKITSWRSLGINRLSIGVQSFFDDDLQWMNRAHDSRQAISSIETAINNGITNLTIDLIYGTPTLTDEQWQQNVSTAIRLGVNHLSCYALTVEEKTALDHFIAKGVVPPIDDEKQERQFNLLMDWMKEAGFEQYEISNFSRPGHHSRHNSNYWSGNPYYGFGPSAHSFDGSNTRWWNIANNNLYIEKIATGQGMFELEKLSENQLLNERIMTGLRTSIGLPIDQANLSIAGIAVSSMEFSRFLGKAHDYINRGKMVILQNQLILTNEGKLFADGIASDLFVG